MYRDELGKGGVKHLTNKHIACITITLHLNELQTEDNMWNHCNVNAQHYSTNLSSIVGLMDSGFDSKTTRGNSG